MDALVTVSTIVIAVVSASISGVFLAFSTFVMKGLGRLTASNGIRAMQSINVTALSPAFMVVLFGTALLAIILAIVGVLNPSSATPWRVAAAALYVGGVIAVTTVFHVPRDNALARVPAEVAEGAGQWRVYLVAWVRGNHVRMLCALAGSALWTVSILPAMTV